MKRRRCIITRGFVNVSREVRVIRRRFRARGSSSRVSCRRWGGNAEWKT